MRMQDFLYTFFLHYYHAYFHKNYNIYVVNIICILACNAGFLITLICFWEVINNKNMLFFKLRVYFYRKLIHKHLYRSLSLAACRLLNLPISWC